MKFFVIANATVVAPSAAQAQALKRAETAAYYYNVWENAKLICEALFVLAIAIVGGVQAAYPETLDSRAVRALGLTELLLPAILSLILVICNAKQSTHRGIINVNKAEYSEFIKVCTEETRTTLDAQRAPAL